MFKYKDCYSKCTKNILTIGNASIERQIVFKKGIPSNRYILNKKTDYKWIGEDDIPIFNLPVIDLNKCNISFNNYISDNYGLSKKFLAVEIVFKEENDILKLIFKIFPELPFITSKIYVKADNYQQGSNKKMLASQDIIESFPIVNKHLKLETIRLFDRTDKNDTLVKKQHEIVRPKVSCSYEGNLFIINSYLDNEGLLLVKNSPTIEASVNRRDDDLKIVSGKLISLIGSGLNFNKLEAKEWTPCYGSTIGVEQVKNLKRLYKHYYKSEYKGDNSQNLFIMSNTWGDRNQDKVVSEEFILKEVVTAKNLGIDIVQIDDGWQKGITLNSALVEGGVWEGYYDFDSDFWQVNQEKFPNGLKPLLDYASKNNLKLGLWFSPDSSDDFKNWEKDVKVLLNLYKKYNIGYFKIDGIKIRNKKCEINLIKLLTKVTKESNNEVSFNLDITSESRFGYLYEKHIGSIFIENRYTDTGNYYPHNTLKNLWQLTEFFPTNKFQFEVLNNKRNLHKYNGDLLAPFHYTIDYLFAITIVANPLLWMELSNLRQEDRKLLTKIISIYKKERQNIFAAEVLPLGQLPDGTSFTGFQIKINEKEGYFLLFREYTNCVKYIYELFDLAGAKLAIDILYSNKKIKNLRFEEVIDKNNKMKVHLPYKRSFVFAKYKVLETENVF